MTSTVRPRPLRLISLRLSAAVLALGLALSFVPVAAAQQEGAASARQTGNVSGLPLPRFVTVSAAPVNVRVGPGTNYDIAWTFTKPRMTVEIVEEFDTWRQIRDIEGDTGWVHQSLLTGERTGLVEPSGDQVPLLASPDPQAGVRAWLTRGLQVDIRACTASFCEVSLTHAQDGRSASYRGYLPPDALFGVYPGETFD